MNQFQSRINELVSKRADLIKKYNELHTLSLGMKQIKTNIKEINKEIRNIRAEAKTQKIKIRVPRPEKINKILRTKKLKVISPENIQNDKEEAKSIDIKKANIPEPKRGIVRTQKLKVDNEEEKTTVNIAHAEEYKQLEKSEMVDLLRSTATDVYEKIKNVRMTKGEKVAICEERINLNLRQYGITVNMKFEPNNRILFEFNKGGKHVYGFKYHP